MTMLTVVLFLAASFAWASTALEADARASVAAWMFGASISVEPRGLRPRGLPALDTVSWHDGPLSLTSFMLLAGAQDPDLSVVFTRHRSHHQDGLYYDMIGARLNEPDRQLGLFARNNETLDKDQPLTDGVRRGLVLSGVVASFFLPGETTRDDYLIGGDRVHAGALRVGAAGYGLGAAGTF